MKFVLLLLTLLVVGCDQSSATNGPNPLAVVAAEGGLAAMVSVDVAPVVGGKCPDCNGTGKVGDSVVFTTCLRCNGTGKLTSADNPAVDSSSKPTDAAQTPCPCGPNCPCKDGYNPNCKCPKCPKCDRCVCQCECPKGEKPSAVNDGAKAAATPFVEVKQEPGDYETHRIRVRLVVSNSCGPCRAIESQTLPPMRAAGWQVAPGKHIEVVYGGGTVPRWERIVDGRVVATQYGFMGPYQVDKFLTGGVEPKRRTK